MCEASEKKGNANGQFEEMIITWKQWTKLVLMEELRVHSGFLHLITYCVAQAHSSFFLC